MTPAEKPDRDRELEEALNSPVKDLPENYPKGLLGDRGLNVGKTDDFTPELNARGVSQENEMRVVWLAVLLGYLLFIVPGFAILWFSKRIPIRTKVVASVVMAVGAAILVWVLYSRG